MKHFTKLAAARAFGCLLTVVAINATAQESGDPPPPPTPPVDVISEADAKAKQTLDREDALTAEIDKLIADYNVTPRPLPEIPDDPPPHEGAMIDMPAYRIEPPDLVIVEVLETLPGRPISGERLVRPDGTILLGFYGDVHVRGLTVKQAKVKIIKHLRKFLTDSVLGLIEEYPLDASPASNDPKPPPVPPNSRDGDLKPPPDHPDQPKKPGEQPKGVSIPEATTRPRARIQVVSSRREQGPRRSEAPSAFFDRKEPGDAREPVSSRQPSAVEGPPAPPEEPTKPIGVRLDDDEITIRINIKKDPASSEPTPSVPLEPMAEAFDEGEWTSRPVPPDESGAVFIDVTAYNSKTYFVLGDVAAPGKIPSTGNETVLDALQYAGGLLNTADRKNIRLVRPGRNGKAGKVYNVDLEAIEERGETATNYQLFPRDRIVVGRDAVVKKTVQIDRTYATIQSVLQSILQTASAVRSVKQAVPDQPDAVIRNLVEFWIRELNRPEGAVFNEQTLRDAVLHALAIDPAAPKPKN